MENKLNVVQHSICLISDDFQQFFEGGFDAKAYASSVIQGLAISQQLSKLAEGILLLDKELHSQVCSTL